MTTVHYHIGNQSDDPYLIKESITQKDKNVYDFFRNYTYLNGMYPSLDEISKFLNLSKESIKKSYFKLSRVGLFIYDIGSMKAPILAGNITGMCRLPFKGELNENFIRPTREAITNFTDLVNTPGFLTYRLMFDLKIPYYKKGDYLIVCPNSDYEDNVVLLCLDINSPFIGRYHKRTHDVVIKNFNNKEHLITNELTILGEIVGSIRMELPFEKLFLRSRIKVLSIEESKDEDNMD